jgi:hypothetical protein
MMCTDTIVEGFWPPYAERRHGDSRHGDCLATGPKTTLMILKPSVPYPRLVT